jgi:hypothetical protein
MKSKKLTWISVIALILIGGAVIMANYQSIFRSVVLPNPEIVSSQADGSSSKLFEYSIKVKGAVTNKGGDGSVIVEATLTQGEKSWTKTMDLYMTSYDTKDFEIIFDEAELLNDEPQYSIRTYALGTN